MLRGTVIPRFPWGIPLDPIKGVPGAPYLAPITLPLVTEGMEPVTLCWSCALAHIMALHCLYLHAGHSRVTDRLLEMARDIASVLVKRASHAGPPLCSAATEAANDIYEGIGPLIATAEAGWWAVAAQASFALSAWYGLAHHDHPEDEAHLAAKLHRSIRAGIVCMYGDGPASRLLDFATGDGAGDLLKLVAKVHVELEVV